MTNFAERVSRVMLVGRFRPGDLEQSYSSAFADLGCTVTRFDIVEAVQRYCRLGAFGRQFNRFVPVEPWIQKANRELVLAARENEPDLVVVFGQSPVRAGPLAQIRTQRSLRLVYVWQDTLAFLNPVLISALPLYDIVASYSREAVPWIARLGAKQVTWIPLAADPHMHFPPDNQERMIADVAFIGQWRPEREEALAA